MKKTLITVLLVLMALSTFFGCGINSTNPVESSSVSSSSSKKETVTIDSDVSSVTLVDEEALKYNFVSLFTIFVNGKRVEVLDEYITSNVKNEAGEYVVTCSYGGESHSVSVVVTDSRYEISLLKDEITINVSLAESYDYLALFTVTKAGKPYAITDQMISSDVKAEEGTYHYTVSILNKSATLTVHVTMEHGIVVYPAFTSLTLRQGQIASYDYTSLFTVYSDGAIMEVTLDMIDSSQVENLSAGESGEVVLNFVHDQTTKTASITVNVVADAEITVNSKNIQTYPNGEFIDLSTLFEITYCDEIIPVPVESISGTIDYSKEGDNVITLTYEGVVYEAVVTVVIGAVVSAQSDTVVIIQGTDKLSYDFASDFEVVINGIRYTAFTKYFVGLDQIDFDVEGIYPLTLSIPYSNTRPGSTGAKFQYFDATVNYVVKSVVSSAAAIDEQLVLSGVIDEFNPFDNLKVVINGRVQNLVSDRNNVGTTYCYAELLSDPIDLTQTGEYVVEIAVYCNGANAEPTVVSYGLTLMGDVIIEADDKVVFAGETAYTTDFFTVFDGGVQVVVTPDMISGAVNFFKAGNYSLTLNYKSFKKTINLIVFDQNLKGVYSTFMTTIAEEGDVDDEGWEMEGVTAKPIQDMVISDGVVTIGDRVFDIATAIDEKTLIIETANVSRTRFTLHYDNGVIVLNPDNSLKMQLNDHARPLIFFNQKLWNITRNFFTLNKSSYYVLSDKSNGGYYSIDVCKAESTVSDEELWYGLKVQLLSYMNSDYIYDVSWGKVTVADDFTQSAGKQTYFYLNDVSYPLTFDATNVRVATLDKELSGNAYAGKTFTATTDGVTSYLEIFEDGSFRYRIGTQSIVSYNLLALENNVGSGLNKEDDTVLLYNFRSRAVGNENLYSYKFKLYPETSTFELLERETLFGQYASDSAYVYFDGYGGGLASFDTSSYYKYRIKYSKIGSLIYITFPDADATFNYESEGVFYLDNLGNIVTAKSFGNESFVGMEFVNLEMTDGAIVKINSLSIPKGASSTETRQTFYDNITIITPNGELDDAAKKECIKTNTIGFTSAGFHQFTIEIQVNGLTVVSYYSIQIIDAIYADNALLGNYKGVVSDSYSLNIDKYGNVTLSSSSSIYTGNLLIDGASFGATLKGKNGKVVLQGALEENGIISVACSGAVTLRDYFTTHSTSVAGAEGVSIRRIDKAENVYAYYLSSNASSLGDLVTLISLNGVDVNRAGAIVLAQKENGEQLKFRIDSWGEKGKGLTLMDEFEGSYVLSGGSDTLVLDGFGNATYNGVKGSYVICTNDEIYFTSNNQYLIFVLSLNDKTFEPSDTVVDKTLVVGYTFSAEYSCYSSTSYGNYSVVTSFEFIQGGRVIITSASDDYAELEYETYDAPFAGTGNYTLTGDVIKVTIDGSVIEFKISNVVILDQLTVISTTLSSDAVGYFSTNTRFQ